MWIPSLLRNIPLKVVIWSQVDIRLQVYIRLLLDTGLEE